MQTVYTLQRHSSSGTYLHGVFVGPFSAMRWAEDGREGEMVWTRIPHFSEWEGQTKTDRDSVWVVKARQVWKY